MEEQCSPLSWAYYFQEEGFEELKQSLLYSTLELEATVIAAHEEISRKDDEILQLKGLLAKIIKERDDFEIKCQQHALEKQLLLQQVQIQLECPISSGTTTNEDDNNALSASDCDENIVPATSSGSEDSLPLTSPRPPTVTDVIDNIPIKKALPEQGKFLQAVMEAGPLLQTLLLAGPLPQWQHPPPQLNSVDIPPVTMLSSPTSKLVHQDSCIISPTYKRDMFNKEVASDFCPTSKYQKVRSPIIVEPNFIN